MVVDLTLLLAYLTSWDERLSGTHLRRAWRGYDFEALDRLRAAGDVSFSRRSKSLVLSDAGIQRAKRLEAASTTVLSSCRVR
jgi:hypothetical protein